MRWCILAALCGLAWLGTVTLARGESPDVTFSWPYKTGNPKTSADGEPAPVKLYFNRRAIGSGPEAFEKILQKVAGFSR